MYKKNSSVLPIVVLVAICIVAGALLGIVHEVTAPVISKVEEDRNQQIYNSLLESAQTFEDTGYTSESCTAALRALDASGNEVGIIIVAQAKGYGGQVPIAVAFDGDGTVLSLSALSNEETPGLGSKATDPTYLQQYVGKPAQTLSDTDVDLVSGATISSKAVLSAFNAAVQAFEEVRS